MAKFKITGDTSGGKAWKAEGINPITGRKMTIRGGEAKHKGKWGKQGGKSKGRVDSYFARHGEADTPKKYINHKNWKEGSQIGKTVNIPNKLFKK